MLPPTNGADRVNSFAVVTYIPDPLGAFLDQLRRELEPATLAPRAHVTVLPPRALTNGVTTGNALEHIQSAAQAIPPFMIRTAHVEVFPITNVVYIGLDAGGDELRRMHVELNGGPVAAVENFKFHPHVTLAQGLTPEQAMEIAAHAQRRWSSFAGARAFSAEVFTLVQNTVDNRWIDLADIVLRHFAASRK
jgi:2'-5' RNA ligase